MSWLESETRSLPQKSNGNILEMQMDFAVPLFTYKANLVTILYVQHY